VGELTSNGKATVLHCTAMSMSSIEVKYNHLRWTQITYKRQVIVGILSSGNAAADWSMFVHCVKRFQPENLD
jgi:hypothetical protein